jgi:hypothetical protein
MNAGGRSRTITNSVTFSRRTAGCRESLALPFRPRLPLFGRSSLNMRTRARTRDHRVKSAPWTTPPAVPCTKHRCFPSTLVHRVAPDACVSVSDPIVRRSRAEYFGETVVTSLPNLFGIEGALSRNLRRAPDIVAYLSKHLSRCS